MSTRGRTRLARILLAPVVSYAALLAASTGALLGIAALRGHAGTLALRFILTVPAIHRMMRLITPQGVVVAQVLGEFAALAGMALVLRREVQLGDIFDRRPRALDLLFGLMGTAGLLVLAELVGVVLVLLHVKAGSLTQLAFAHGIGSPWLLLGLALVAGFAEETTFRGYLLRAFNGRMALWPAILVESAVFAAFHSGWGLAPGPFLAIAAIGVALSLIAVRTNIYRAMVAHAGYDALAFLIALHLR
jgi:membrane protease YdiL (CAAX protease family)